MKTDLGKSYFPSGWIANFGVVPLLLLRAFLLLPIFDFLFALLILVTAVFDTILNLLNGAVFKDKDIQWLSFTVKALMTLFFISNGLRTSANADGLRRIEEKPIFMAIGQHKEISVENLKKYSVGNPQVLGVKVRGASKNILLKGKKQGFSELLILKSGESSIVPVFVHTKKNQQKLARAKVELSSLGLGLENISGTPVVSGVVNTLEQLKKLRIIFKKSNNLYDLNILIKPKLKSKVIAKAYSVLFDLFIDDGHCAMEGITILCKIPIDEKVSNSIQMRLKDRYSIHLEPTNLVSPSKNKEIKLKFIQIEKRDGSEFSLGLDSLNIPIKDIFDGQAFNALSSEKNIVLGESEFKIKTIAHPEFLLRTGNTSEIRIGAEIPFQNLSMNNNSLLNTTSFLFVGLKVKIKLEKSASDHLIQYEVQLNRPSAEGTLQSSGSKEKSTVTIKNATSTKLFDIGFKANAIDKKRFPVLSKIPLLGTLFTSKKNSSSYKKVIGIIHVH